MALVVVGLVALGAGAFLVGSSRGSPTARVVGGNRAINAGARSELDIRANSSPTLARNPIRPDNLAVANRIDTPAFSCALHVSADAGATWQETRIPFPAGEELPERCFAPDVTFGADGTMYLSFVTLRGVGNSPSAAWVVASVDGGRTLSIPARATGPLAFQVRLAAHPAKPGHLYLTWLQGQQVGNLAFAAGGNPVLLSRSEDGGLSWQEPVRVSSASRQRVVAPSVVTGPGGDLYVLYLDVGEDSLDYHGAHEGKGGDPYPGTWSLVLARAGPEGQSWRETVVEKALVPTERFIVFVPPFPSLAVDQRRGRVYAGFHDGRLGDADVWVWASTDGGATFAAPERVNDTPVRDATRQYLPKLAVAPGGRLDVVYYDRRADPRDHMNEVSFQSSYDGGRTFTDRLVLSDRAFDSRIGFGSERGMPDLGSRLGLVSTDQRAVAAWSDTRAGTQASNKQDLARAVVRFSG